MELPIPCIIYPCTISQVKQLGPTILMIKLPEYLQNATSEKLNLWLVGWDMLCNLGCWTSRTLELSAMFHEIS